MLALGIACTMAALAWLYLVAAHGGYWRTSQRLPRVTAEPDAWPDVVAVVPARNEAEMLPVTLPELLGQEYPGALSVIVVDDGSSDGTGEVAAKLAAGSARPLRVISGAPARTRKGLARSIADVDDAELPSLLGDLGGHDLHELLTAFRAADDESGRPTVLFAYTIPSLIGIHLGSEDLLPHLQRPFQAFGPVVIDFDFTGSGGDQVGDRPTCSGTVHVSVTAEAARDVDSMMAHWKEGW